MVFTAVFTRHGPCCAVWRWDNPTYHQPGPSHTTREAETPTLEQLQPSLRGLHIHSKLCAFSRTPVSASAICRGLRTSRGRPLVARCKRGSFRLRRICQGRNRNPQLGVRWMDSMALHADHEAGRPPEQWKVQLSGNASLGGCHWMWSTNPVLPTGIRRRKAVRS